MSIDGPSDDTGILLLGRQGAGKSLVGRLAASRINAVFLSVGELLRAEQQTDSSLGRRIGERIDAGEGVPPDVSYGLLDSALRAREPGSPVILDGVPRLADETERVRALLGREPSRVVVLDVPTVIAVARLETRLICEGCGWAHGPGWPARAGKCTSCGRGIKPRPDDSGDRIKRRHELWGVESRRIIRYYEELRVVRTVAADAPVLEVVQRVLDALTS